MLIAARNAMMAGKRLPYDAEIAYLGCNGTQYIDTGLLAKDITSFDVQFMPEPNSVNYGIYFTTGSITDFVFAQRAANNSDCYLRYDHNKTINAFNVISTSTMNRAFISNERKLVINNTVVDDIASTFLGTISEYMYIASAGTEPSRRIPIRLGRFRFYGADNRPLRDLIPVRVGTTGYMYDKVSGQLFGNAGTGDFILGPDK